MKELYLIRHGQTDYLGTGGLTRKGIREVQELDNILKDRLLPNLKYISITSPTKRATQTKSIYKATIQKIAGVLEERVERLFQETFFSTIYYSDEIKLEGQKRVNFLDKISEEFDVGIVTSHKGVIKATGIEYGKKHGVNLIPEFNLIRSGVDYTDPDIRRYTIKDLIRKKKIKNEGEATNEMIREQLDAEYPPRYEIPDVYTANAIYFNLETKEMEIIRPHN